MPIDIYEDPDKECGYNFVRERKNGTFLFRRDHFFSV
jgi:hypothetical protein